MSRDEQVAAKPPLGECPLTASHTRRACDNGGSCWCMEHPEEVAAINAHPEVVEARSAARRCHCGAELHFPPRQSAGMASIESTPPSLPICTRCQRRASYCRCQP